MNKVIYTLKNFQKYKRNSNKFTYKIVDFMTAYFRSKLFRGIFSNIFKLFRNNIFLKFEESRNFIKK